MSDADARHDPGYPGCDPSRCATCPNQGRRKFLHACIGGAGTVTVAALSYPILTFLSLPQRVGGTKPVELALADLAVGQAYYAEFQGRQIIVLMTDAGPRVFDAACTHLGCNVVWETAQGVFHCPCHGALFSDEGRALAGPVSAPLRTVPFEITDDMLIIS